MGLRLSRSRLIPPLEQPQERANVHLVNLPMPRDGGTYGPTDIDVVVTAVLKPDAGLWAPRNAVEGALADADRVVAEPLDLSF